MTDFVCMNCKYRFKSEDGKTCPYCGKRSVEKDKSASELLNEIENMLEQ